MSVFLLAGGGTGGHVNPLLALAELLRNEGHEVIALGTKEGLETRLVPERGFELQTVARLPFPRKPSLSALKFPFRFLGAVSRVRKLIRKRSIAGVVGFGGYASAPAYVAAWLEKTPLVIHEANALAGFANRLGAKFTKYRAVAFKNSDLKDSTLTGMPIRAEIVAAIGKYDQQQARVELGLDPQSPTLLVTGGSLGAASINRAVIEAKDVLLAAGIQILHIVGDRSEFGEADEPGYKRIAYCNSMDAAISAASFAISRAGASTVSEFAAFGLPALYIPYPVGNGEQRLNAKTVVDAGGGILLEDKDFNSGYITQKLIPVISRASKLAQMAAAAKSTGITDATERLRDLLALAVDTVTRD
jgi:UDP-N-acetylglucosamine--N-acetylmuramyl-(pentapeptide) pyrophosphoryl-undecaprenol N-acetylglucosamine transferase